MIYYENEINWNQREDEFIKLCEDIKSTNKNNEYDCVIAVSGGKDKQSLEKQSDAILVDETRDDLPHTNPHRPSLANTNTFLQIVIDR